MKKRNCLKQVSPTGREKINREPVNATMRYAKHTHRGTRDSSNARHRARGEGAENILQKKRARQTIDGRREEKKEGVFGRKDSRNRRTYLAAEDETVTSVVHGN